MTKKERDTLMQLQQMITTEDVSNAFLVQLIELGGEYLNLSTIPDYAKKNNLSYNGVKNNREIKQIFNVKFVIDNL
jgi:hypothetical protein